MDDPPFADQIQRDFVAPFYSSVNMRLPINDQAALALSQAAHTVALDQILWMLGTHWRPRRVGAWFALARREKELDEPLLESLRTSRGYLTAPDLGFAAVRRMKQGALSALRHYESIAAKKKLASVLEHYEPRHSKRMLDLHDASPEVRELLKRLQDKTTGLNVPEDANWATWIAVLDELEEDLKAYYVAAGIDARRAAIPEWKRATI